MITFNYKARNTKTDKIEKNTIQGESEAVAARLLMSQGLVPIEITPIGKGGGILSALKGRVSGKDLVIFTRQLSTMLNAGLPLAQSMATVQEQTNNKAFKVVIADLITSINSGMSLSAAIAKYPKIFSKVYVALVQAGETSGTLDASLKRLADQQEHDASQLSKIRGAMVYPAIVLAVIVAVVIFMLVSLVPQVSSMYNDMHKKLPLSTEILMTIVHFFEAWWYLIFVVLGIGMFFARQWIRTGSGRLVWDSFKLNAPLFKTLLRKMYMARFSRTTQVLLQSGVSIMETLKIAADSVGNVVIRKEILQAVGKVKNGKSLSEALSGGDYVLPFVPQMVKIGESAGSIDTMLAKVSDYYDKEVDAAIATISTLIEPILMVLMAFMIGFIVLAVLLPIYGLTGSTSGL